MALGALAHSQAISEAWRQVYTGDFIPVAETSVWQPLPDSSQNIYLIAEMQDHGNVLLVHGVLCVDAAGDIRWVRRFPERVFEILLDPQGNLQAFAYDGIYTFRPSGELTRIEPRPMRGSYPGINAAAIDAVGNRYVLFGWQSATLICLSPDGQLVWQQEYPDLHPLDVFVDGSGNILVALGMPDSSGRFYYPQLRCLTPQGAHLWVWQCPYRHLSYTRILGRMPDGRFCVEADARGYYISPDGTQWSHTPPHFPPTLLRTGARSALLLQDGSLCVSSLWRDFPRYFLGVECFSPVGTLAWYQLQLTEIATSYFGLTLDALATNGAHAVWYAAVHAPNATPEIVLYRLNSRTGGIQWRRVAPSLRTDMPSLVVYPNDESVLLGGSPQGVSVLRYDGAGNLLHRRDNPIIIPTRDSARATSDGQGGVYALVAQSSTSRLVRYAPNGQLLWEQPLPYSGEVARMGQDAVVVSPYMGDVLVQRYRADGSLLWQRTHSQLLNTGSYSILEEPVSEAVYLGENARLTKLGADGAIQWSYDYPSGYSSVGRAVHPEAVALVLYNYSTRQTRLVRLSASGALQWDIALPASYGAQMGFDGAGNLYIAHQLDSTRARLAAYTPTGELRWEREELINAQCLAVAPRGPVYIAAFVQGTLRLRAYTVAGQLLWEREVPEVLAGEFPRAQLRVDALGRVFLSTPTTPQLSMPRQALVIGYTAEGRPLGQLLFPNQADAYLMWVYSASLDPQGRFLTLAGQLWTDTGDYDGFVVHHRLTSPDVDGNGCVDEADLLAVLFNFGSGDPAPDLNGDGVVDDADLLTVLFSFGEGC
jgi:outer membrane protein assembly factor BamB